MILKVTGGVPIYICAIYSGRGGTWNAAGLIVLQPTSREPLYIVPATGGEPSPVTELSVERSTHAAFAELFDDSVVGDRLADHLASRAWQNCTAHKLLRGGIYPGTQNGLLGKELEVRNMKPSDRSFLVGHRYLPRPSGRTTA